MWFRCRHNMKRNEHLCLLAAGFATYWIKCDVSKDKSDVKQVCGVQVCLWTTNLQTYWTCIDLYIARLFVLQGQRGHHGRR